MAAATLGGPNRLDAVPLPAGTVHHGRERYIDLSRASEVRITIDPRDLHDPFVGIDVDGLDANFSHTGPQWQREACLEIDGGPGSTVRLRIAGSGSRSLPKRSFHARFTTDAAIVRGDTCGALTLRADASPNAYLRNSLMTAVVDRAHCELDMQPHVPVRLLINGRYHGAYRVMAKKNRSWLEHLAGGGDIDVLEGPDQRAIHGNRSHFTQARALLASGAPVDSLMRWIDLRSLIDLACLDLYTGRADHDLNVRCWRPRRPEGRWRWVLFDLDIWAPVTENSLVRMLGDAPDETPFLSDILRHDHLRDSLLTRMVVLVNTVLSPDHATALLDSLYGCDQSLLGEDHERWRNELQRPDPERCRRELDDFLRRRPAMVLDHMAAAIGSTRTSTIVRCEPPGAGRLTLHDLFLTDDSVRLEGIRGTVVRLEAFALPGYEFVGWENDEPQGPSDPLLDHTGIQEVIARFRPVAWSGRHRMEQTME
jgi:hypothetical protein